VRQKDYRQVYVSIYMHKVPIFRVQNMSSGGYMNTEDTHNSVLQQPCIKEPFPFAFAICVRSPG